jgi:hypothetical protein
MSDQKVEITLPDNWHDIIVVDGVHKHLPGIYEWQIEGRGSYIGKYTHISRPLKEYGRNVTKIVNGRPYRPANPDGFRYIHRELHAAHRECRKITLIILENGEPTQLGRREAELIAERGNLNNPPFGRRKPA